MLASSRGAYLIAGVGIETTDLADLDLLEVGIDDGTTTTGQLVIGTGTLPEADEIYVQLEPGRTIRTT